jgi:flagellar assembly protein FliH
MASNGKLIKASDRYRPASNIIIGGADLSDLPNKQDLINQHLLEARTNAHEERQEILQQAQQEADFLVEQAREEAKQIKLEAYEEGFQIGKAEAMMLIKEDFQETLRNCNLVLESIKKEREECLEDEEQRVYRAVILIAKQILKKDLSTDPNLNIEFISQAIKKLESKAEVKILIDTATAQCLHTAKNELIQSNPGLENLTIVANSELKSGDLILESGSERLDLRLETQLEELAKEILS